MQKDALRILRVIKKKSQTQAAQAIGVSLQTYRKKEADMNALTLKEINTLIEFYDIEPSAAGGIFFDFKVANNATAVC